MPLSPEEAVAMLEVACIEPTPKLVSLLTKVALQVEDRCCDSIEKDAEEWLTSGDPDLRKAYYNSKPWRDYYKGVIRGNR